MHTTRHLALLALALGQVIVLLAFAAMLTRAGKRPQNRLLVLWLGLIALAYLARMASGLLPQTYATALWTDVVTRGSGMSAYLVLVAFAGTIETPWARPFASDRARRLLLGAASLVCAVLAIVPGWLLSMDRTPSGYEVGWIDGSLTIGMLALMSVASAYVLAVLLQSFLRAPRGGLDRARAGAALLGLALMNGTGALNAGFMLLLEAISPPTHTAYMESAFFDALPFVQLVLSIFGVAILVFGILRLQLFEVDLRVKWTLRRGTVAGVFVGAFVVASAVAEQYLQQYGVLVGGVAVGALLLLFRPIERVADRLADSALPRVQDTPEWRDARRLEIYRTAVRLALADARITRDEEIHLADLATQIGLDPRRALDLRVEVEREAGLAA